jgi:heme exporter protein C
MKLAWWKLLSIFLLFYTLIFGLLVPLKTGITDVNPRKITCGQKVTLAAQGYNSVYTRYKSPRAWLKLDSVHALAAAAIRVKNDRLMEIDFEMPAYLPDTQKVTELTLVIDDVVDGVSLLPNATFLNRGETVDTAAGQRAWSKMITGTNAHKGIAFPYRNILYESIRNTYFHVPMWFVMFAMFGAAVYYSIQYLRTGNLDWDIRAVSFTKVGILFGLLGLFTGALWATYTWGEPFPMDLKIIMTYTALSIYFAYFLLRGAFESFEQRARISAVYSIFAFASLIPLLYVVPRLAGKDSLHPGNGGNIAFGSQDLDNTMRFVFYPASIGWILLGVWIATLVTRAALIEDKLYSK